jgi:NADH-ubiquinone oxidoreductase chain 5
MYLLLIFLPLFSSLIILLGGRFFGRHGSAYLAIGTLAFVCLNAWFFFLQKAKNESLAYLTGYTWIRNATSNITFDLYIDNVTLVMFVIITTISFIVHWYSYDYMYHDPHLPRFVAYLSIFTFFMLLLVAAGDLTILFIGWEGVGLLSYLLINFWYTRIQANKSALKAIFVNKIGDIAMLAAIVFFYICSGTTNIVTLQALAPYLQYYTVAGINIFTLGLFCFVIGAVGKSAQLFLHVWLPDAMEGPTPVSALLHAATMVTAGVFLIIRNSALFEVSSSILFIIVLIGALTTFFAATTGVVQHDIKRIIAFSTCSQLGYMFVACGLSGYSIGLFHLFNHAFFKALLFLAAGSVIHALADEQDIRKMGALAPILPLTFSFFMIASLSLMGVPFLSGFYSKDLIIELQGGTYMHFGSFFFLLLVCSAVLTAFYSARLIFYVFLNRPLWNVTVSPHDASWWVQLPLIFLTLLSITSGYLFEDLFVGVGSTFFSGALFILPHNWYSLNPDFIPYVFSNLPLFGSVAGVWLSWQTFMSRSYYYYYYYYYYCRMMFFMNRWSFDYVYNRFLFGGMQKLLQHFYYFLDKGLIELFGPTGTFRLILVGSRLTTALQSGSLTWYLQLITVCFLLGLCCFPIFLSVN